MCGSFAAGKFRAKGINNMSFGMQAGSDTLKHTDTHTHTPNRSRHFFVCVRFSCALFENNSEAVARKTNETNLDVLINIIMTRKNATAVEKCEKYESI